MRAEGSVEMQQPIQTNCVCSISLHPGWKRTFWIKQVGLNEAPGNGREQAAPVPYTLTFAFRRIHHLSLVVVSTQQLQKRWQAGCGLDVDMLVHVIGSVRCWLQAEMWLCSWWIAGFTPFTDRPEARKVWTSSKWARGSNVWRLHVLVDQVENWAIGFEPNSASHPQTAPSRAAPVDAYFTASGPVCLAFNHLTCSSGVLNVWMKWHHSTTGGQKHHVTIGERTYWQKWPIIKEWIKVKFKHQNMLWPTRSTVKGHMRTCLPAGPECTKSKV